LNDKDPPYSERISYEDPDRGYVKVECSTPMPPNKPDIEALFLIISQQVSITDLHKLFTLCPLEGFHADFEVEVEQVDGSPSDGQREQFVLYANGLLWHQAMKM